MSNYELVPFLEKRREKLQYFWMIHYKNDHSTVMVCLLQAISYQVEYNWYYNQ